MAEMAAVLSSLTPILQKFGLSSCLPSPKANSSTMTSNSGDHQYPFSESMFHLNLAELAFIAYK